MKITINNKVYYPEEIISTNLAQITGFEKAVIEFAKDWLTGKEQFIIPTSGSTGVPKPITVTRGQMEYSALQTVNALNLKKGNTALLCLNPEFIAGKMMLVRAFVRELDLVVVAPSSNPVLDIHEDTVIDFAALVPMQVQTILDSTSNNVAKLESMKSVIIGGAPINPVLLDRIKKLKANFYATYGMTETLSHIALKKLNGTEASDQFIAFEGVKLGQDARGCLTINSPVTLNNTITTNDVVELLSPSAFRWIGRADFIINSGGIKLSPEILEEKVTPLFSSLDITSRFLFCGLPDERLGEKLVLVIEGKVLPLEKITLLKAQLAQVLLKYESPKEIYFLPEFPETASGKINRMEIKSRLSK